MSASDAEYYTSEIDKVYVYNKKLATLVPNQIQILQLTIQNTEKFIRDLKAQFAIENITVDTTRFHYAVSGVNIRAMREVRDILMDPSEIGRYEKLKMELVRRLSTLEDKNIRQLLARKNLGELKPSQFLRYLMNFAGKSAPETILRSIWIGRLPRGLQADKLTVHLKERRSWQTGYTRLHLARRSPVSACHLNWLSSGG
ncbi:hypothetical protein M0802_011935 [Mischocyttarus mexicanus]|nr:hypothetical protein M0802_011935 [Mischocyttarus mexicanus]